VRENDLKSFRVPSERSSCAGSAVYHISKT
jgi:hypothetical protein